MKALPRLLIIWLATGLCLTGFSAEPKPPNKNVPGSKTKNLPVATAEQTEYFEKHVRPVLAEKCQSCHGAKKSMAGLRLDAAEWISRGSDSGETVVQPGDPTASLLIRVVQHSEPGREMPPEGGKLPPTAIAHLAEWIKMGAPWPAETNRPAATVDPKNHWAFRPVQRPTPPTVKQTAWPTTDVDRFVLARLEAAKLRPNPEADRATLIRRAHYVLTGLPPTAEQIAEFVADASPNAWEKVIDRLLADPAYGERWGRHWLDVARYADTKGYVFQEERRYPYSYTYRDYVIAAFNADKPYDRFLVEQLAADQLNLGGDKRPLAAMGFLTLGRRFLNNIPDIIDDRIDVTARGLMALTVSCARCHDHKFDPIPTADYYSLYGVFAASVEPKDLPIIGNAADVKANEAYQKGLAERQGKLTAFLDGERARMSAEFRRRLAESLLAAADPKFDVNKSSRILTAGELPGPLIGRWRSYLAEQAKGHSPIWAPWIALAALPEGEFAARAGALLRSLGSDAKKPIHPRVLRALTEPPVSSLKQTAERYGQLFAEPDKSDPGKSEPGKSEPGKSEPGKSPPGKNETEDADATALRAELLGEKAPTEIPAAELDRYLNRAQRDRQRDLQKELDRWTATSRGAPARAMVLNDAPGRLGDPVVFRRGNPNNRGATVKRQFLEVLAGPQRTPFTRGSGRLELAEAIASPKNPLTARVMMNRVWMHHFGAPLVRTVSDFGLRSEPPTHPELLDWLADEFVRRGWSLKQMHKLLMLSAAWRQSSDDRNRADAVAVDAENGLYWRANRRRMDFEGLRDALLAVAGTLDRSMGGPGVDITVAPFPPRRTVYAFIERQNLPGVFRSFDLASPDVSTPQRYATTVPQQALYLMNSPFVLGLSQSVLARPEVAAAAGKGVEDFTVALYRVVYGRLPSTAEIELARGYLGDKPDVPAAPEATPSSAWQYGASRFDPKTGKVFDYRPLSHFSGQAYQAGAKLPDGRLGWAMLSADGGHPGREFAVVRRWTSPIVGTLKITGRLKHTEAKGNGVRASLVSSRAGLIKSWSAHNGRAAVDVTVEVQVGDVLDFVVDCQGEESFDSFSWSIDIARSGSAGGDVVGSSSQRWNAASDFAGPPAPPIDRRQLYVQALLLANEFAFVD